VLVKRCFCCSCLLTKSDWQPATVAVATASHGVGARGPRGALSMDGKGCVLQLQHELWLNTVSSCLPLLSPYIASPVPSVVWERLVGTPIQS
jgi:hypothetical protein